MTGRWAVSAVSLEGMIRRMGERRGVEKVKGLYSEYAVSGRLRSDYVE